MAPFRWPTSFHDICLCKEVLEKNPTSVAEWEKIAEVLSEQFSTPEKPVEVKGRGCRERLDRLLQKYRQDDKRCVASKLTRILNAQKGIPQTANGKLQTAVCSPWETSILRCLISVDDFLKFFSFIHNFIVNRWGGANKDAKIFFS